MQRKHRRDNGLSGFHRRGFEFLEQRLLLSVTSSVTSNAQVEALVGAITTTNSSAPVYPTGTGTDGNHESANGGSIFPSLAQSGSLIHLDQFRADPRFLGITGQRFSTVIIDTGIDLNHPYFGPDANGDGTADRIVYQFDYANNDANASDDAPLAKGGGHGSNVASIVASQDTTYPGMAPGVDIIALKVFKSADGSGNWAYTEKALQWVVENAATYNIASVNMSLSDTENYASATTMPGYGISDELAALAGMGVIVVSSAGNEYFKGDQGVANGDQGVAYPAADPNSLAVGAVWDANLGRFDWQSGAIDFTTAPDRIVSFSQRSTTLTDIFAPGAMITGAGPNGDTLAEGGTSQAAPHIAGIAVLAQQLAVRELGRRLTPTEFVQLIKNTGQSIFDGDDENDNVTNTNATYKRVDMYALAQAIVPAISSAEIAVVGPSLQSIADGDTTPSAAEGTDFGSRDITTGTFAIYFGIRNLGAGVLNLIGNPSIQISGANPGDFTVTSFPATSVPVFNPSNPFYSMTGFEVTFNPNAVGLRSAVVTIWSNDSDESPYTFAIQGMGTTTEIAEIDVVGSSFQSIVDGDESPSVGDGTDFGSWDVTTGTSVASFGIRNLGTGVLNLTGNPAVQISGANADDFTITSLGSTSIPVYSPLNPFYSMTVLEITFNPNAVGLRTAVVTIWSNDSDESPYTFSIQGTGTASPEIQIRAAIAGGATVIESGDTTPSPADNTEFGSLAVGASATRLFLVDNLGSGPLLLLGNTIVQISGTNAPDFSIITQPSITSIVPGWGTYFELRFRPTAMGLRTATVTIASNDADEPFYTFSVQGVATAAPEIEIRGLGVIIAAGDNSPAVVDGTDFGTRNLGISGVGGEFSVYNVGAGILNLTGAPTVQFGGANSGDFSLGSQSSLAPLGPNESYTFQVVFNPSAIGLRTATVTIYSDDSDESPYTFTIQGTGAASPEIDVRGGGITIVDGDTTPSTTDDTDFGAVDVTSGNVVRAFGIVNIGAGPLNLTGTPQVQVSGANASEFTASFVYLPSGNTIAGGQYAVFQITFNPAALGVRTATISIANNDSDENPFNFNIQGIGTTGPQNPEIDVRGGGITIFDGDTTPSTSDDTNFGSVDVSNGNVVHAFGIVNLGNATLNMTGAPLVQITGANAADFTSSFLYQPSGSSIAVGQYAVFQITFNPSASGLRTATVTIANNDSDENPFNFNISGTGITSTPTPEIDIRGGGLTIVDGDATPSVSDDTHFGSQNVASGQVIHAFGIVNLGTGPLNLTGNPLVQITGANAADFTVLQIPTSSISAGDYTVFQIAFDPSAAGLRTATLSIANNDSDENPYNFTLQGTGLSSTPAPEIDVRGGGISIADGDTSPTTLDDTDFGDVNGPDESTIRSFGIVNLGTAALNLSGNPRVQVTGGNASDFTISTQPASPVLAGEYTVFQVTFRPSGPGLRTATISITNNDSDENPFNFNVQGTGIQVGVVERFMDDGEAGYAESGSGWSSRSSSAAYNGDFRLKSAGNGGSQANWSFAGLVSGQYEVFAHWAPGSSRATNAPYSVLDGATVRGTVLVNQRTAPATETVSGVTWQRLGQFTINGGTLLVRLTDNANGSVVADGIRIRAVAPASSMVEVEGTQPSSLMSLLTAGATPLSVDETGPIGVGTDQLAIPRALDGNAFHAIPSGVEQSAETESTTLSFSNQTAREISIAMGKANDSFNDATIRHASQRADRSNAGTQMHLKAMIGQSKVAAQAIDTIFREESFDALPTEYDLSVLASHAASQPLRAIRRNCLI